MAGRLGTLILEGKQPDLGEQFSSYGSLIFCLCEPFVSHL